MGDRADRRSVQVAALLRAEKERGRKERGQRARNGKRCRADATNGLPVMPGVATSSEIQAARRLGLVWLKAFPVAQLGSAWVRAQLAPFPEARFVATGGVDADNAREFLDAGARVAAIGSALADDNQLAKLATFAPPRAVS